MSRSADAAHLGLLSLLPSGWIWPHGQGSVIAAVLRPIAEELAVLEETAEAMMEEVDPRTATLCMDDWERVLGPDPCGRDAAALALAPRRALAHQRWTARGGQSIAYFRALAAARGVAIGVEEARLTRAGGLRAGDELINAPEQYAWIIRLTLGDWQVFRAGASVAGDLLYAFALADVECDIRRAAPAHTIVVFRYVEPISTDVSVSCLTASGTTVPGAEIDLSWEIVDDETY